MSRMGAWLGHAGDPHAAVLPSLPLLTGSTQRWPWALLPSRPLRALKEMLRIIPFNYVVTEMNVFVQMCFPADFKSNIFTGH